MSGSKGPASKSRKKSTAKPATAPSIKDKNAFKSTEFVKDSDDEEDDAGNPPVKKGITEPTKPKAPSLSLAEKNRLPKPAQSLPKPTTERKKPPPPSDLDESGADEVSSNEQASNAGGLLSNALGKVQSKTLAKRPDTITRPSLKRKNPSPSDGGTGSTGSEDDESSNPRSAKRRRGSPTPIPKPGAAEKAARLVKPSRQRTSSGSGPDDDDVSQRSSEEDVAANSWSRTGNESSNGSASGEDAAPAAGKKPKYGHLKNIALRDMTKSLQCPRKADIEATINSLRTASWLRARNYFVTCFI